MSDLTQPPDEFNSESAHSPKRGRTTPPIPEELRNWFVLPLDEDAEDMDARPGGDESDAGLYPAAGMTEIDGQVIGRSHVVHRPTPAQPTREPAHNAHPRPSTSPAHLPAQSASMAADDRDTDGSDADEAEAHGSATIPSYIDTVVVASLADRTVSVNPGASLSLWVNVLNNGPLPALFRVHVEGWIEAEWVAVHPLHQAVPPGERATMRIDIAPPRAPGSRAGTRQLVIVVQAAEYPGRQSRLVATLTINGYDDIILDDFQPRRVETSWGRRTAALLVPVRNQGNRATAVRISGQCSSTPCRFGFKIGANEHRREESAIFTVEPGQTVPVRVRVRPDRMPIFGGAPRTAPLQIVAGVVGKPQVPRAALGTLIRRPLLGPIQIVLAGLVGFLLVFGLIMLSAIGMGLTQLVTRSTARNIANPPVVAVVVPVNQLVPDTAPPPVTGQAGGAAAASNSTGAPVVVSVSGQLPGAGTASTGAGVTADDAVRDPSVPLVGAGQISGPGQPAAPAQPLSTPESSARSSAPAPAPVSSGRDNLTYAQMFQEIALRYDLNWRMLAAQAYVESGFDTVALGADGDLGLMQILPRTWNEWAPTVDASDPFDAYSNVLVAAAYLDYLRTQLAQRGVTDVRWMLVAYNWGPEQVNEFLTAGNSWQDLAGQLQAYATDILGIANTIPLE